MGALGVLLFGGIGVLTVAAWWRMRTRGQETLARWNAEEQEMADAPEAFHWEDHVEDPDAWKGDDDSEP